jgi:hypothetical protein
MLCKGRVRRKAACGYFAIDEEKTTDKKLTSLAEGQAKLGAAS